jgi:hypothetical protein
MRNTQNKTDKGKTQTGNENIKFDRNKQRPENKDNLDHREGLEQDNKGNDVTHNSKDQHSRGSGKKGKK